MFQYQRLTKRDFMITLLILTLCLTLISFGKFYYSWKQSLSGIVLGTILVLVSILSISLMSYNIDTVHLISKWIETGSLKESITLLKSSTTLNKIVTVLLAVSSSIGVTYLGALGIKNYKGPVRQSEWKAKTNCSNDEEHTLLKLLLADMQFLLKPNNVVFEPGINPFKIEPNNKAINWKDLSLDLLLTSNSDISAKKSNWSNYHCCHICEKTNYATGTKSKIYLFPLTSGDFLKMMEARFQEIINVATSEDQIIFCYENEKASQEFYKFAHSNDLTSLNKLQLIQQSIDVKNYAKNILKRFQESVAISYERNSDSGSKLTSEVTLNNTFSEPRLYEQEEGKTNTYTFNAVISSWLANNSVPQLALLGEFGQGKSTALLEYCARWANNCLTSDEHDNEFSRVPLLIELRGRSPSSFPTPEAMLGDWGNKHGFTGKQLLNLVQSKMAILIFEGFDEVKNAGNKLDRYSQFNALWKYAFQGSKIIFTGRPNFFFNENELNEFLNINDTSASAGTVTSKVYRFNFMELSDIRKVLRNIEPVLAEEIISRASIDSSLMDIAKRPSMLPVIVSQWERIKQSKSFNESITPASIVKGYIEATYVRKEEQVLELGAYQILPWEIRHFITKAIAQFMFAAEAQNTISAIDIDNVTEKVIKDFDKVFLRSDSPQKLRQAVTQLNLDKIEKNETEREVAEKIGSEVRSNGLLVPDPASGSQNFYFPHKQFYEFILGDNFASFHSPNQTNESKVINKFSNYKLAKLGMHGLTGLMRLEPMSFIYFSGLFKADFLRNFEPSISPSKYLKILKPYVNLVELYLIKINERFLFPNDSIIKLILKTLIPMRQIPTISKKESEPKYSIKSVLDLFILTIISMPYTFFTLPSIFFLKCDAEDSLKIKFILMKFSCDENALDKKFGHGAYRKDKERWFQERFINTD